MEALMPEADRLAPGKVPQGLSASELEALRRLGYLDGDGAKGEDRSIPADEDG